MSVRDVYQSNSKFLKAAHLGGRVVKVVIAKASIEESFDHEMRILLDIKGTDKRLTLNKTNALILGEAFGDNEAAWAGREIELCGEKTNFAGKIVDTIKVRIPYTGAVLFNEAPAPLAGTGITGMPPAGHPAFEDDIPF